MKLETKIAYLILCLALPLTTACKKTPIPAEDPQPAEIGFTAASQAVEMKSGTKATTPLSQFHQDFGVWGIARQAINSDYILWDDNDLTQVNKQQGSDIYVPISPAYWFTGYVYDFIAVAPYTNSGISSTSVHSATNTLTFAYDLASKYALKGNTGTEATDHYQFDLMAAADHTNEIAQNKPSTQNLIFWHLFAKISINVRFVDAAGTAVNTGSVSQIRLKNVDTDGTYAIAYDGEEATNLSVTFTNGANSNATLTFEGSTGCVHIVPQTVTGFEMYIDFTLNNVEYKDFKLNLNAAGNPAYYDYNQSYNWNITIGPKEDISFKVTVDPWTSSVISDGDSDSNNDIEII